MSLNKSHTPISKHLISLAGKGFSMLDEASQKEVLSFIQSQQHASGGFMDRGGKPEIYYSLFGTWISKALDLKVLLQNHKQYIEGIKGNPKSAVDKYTLILIHITLFGSEYKAPSFWSLLKIIFKKGENLNPAYGAFLFLLVYDALYPPNRFLYFSAKIFIQIYRLPANSSSTMVAAFLVARTQLALPIKEEAKKLLSYFEEGKGFKIYENMETADLLSTAVALFALKRARQDLRIVTPDCLALIQNNFDSGAFLSGDGNESKDLEYTFYGLLALGTLA